MSWGSRTRFGVNTIINYADAVALHDKIKPMQSGAHKGLKPVGDRRKPQNQIRRGENGDIILKMYVTDVVTFEPDGKILISNGGWASKSTHDYISEILGVSVTTSDRQTWIKTTEGYLPLRPHTKETRDMHTGAQKVHDIFIREGNWLLAAVNPNYPVVYRVNKTQAALVRKPYAEFRRYMHGMVKLRDYESWSNTTVAVPTWGEICAAIDTGEPEAWASGVIAISRHCIDYGWEQSVGPRKSINLKKMDKFLDKLIYGANKELVFVKEEIRTGQLITDKWWSVACG